MVTDENQTSTDRVDPLADLAKKWSIELKPFRSDLALIGPLIVALRRAWYSVAARWQDQLLIEQQSQFNHAVYETLLRQERLLSEVYKTLLRQERLLSEVYETLLRQERLLYERGLETGLLAEGLAQLKLVLRQDGSDKLG